jgi:hypothetical protein
VTHTKLGSSPDAEGDTGLVTLTFKALHAGKSSVRLLGLTTVDGQDASTTVPVKGKSLDVSVAPASTSISATAKVSSIKHSDADLISLSATVKAPAGPSVVGYVEAVIDGRPVATSAVRNGKASLTATVFGRGTKTVVVKFVPLTRDLAPSTTTLTVKLG